MAGTQFKKVDYRAERLIDEIQTGEIGLPDIQRPFVWKAVKVRNLFDSMYRGFPVGYLLFWSETVAGFATSEGGRLLVGISDSGEALGLKKDLVLLGKKPDLDGFELWLRRLLETAVDRLFAASVQVSFPALKGVEICLVEVPKYERAVYANRPGANRTDTFYVRSGNSTQELTSQEVVAYLADRSQGLPLSSSAPPP